MAKAKGNQPVLGGGYSETRAMVIFGRLVPSQSAPGFLGKVAQNVQATWALILDTLPLKPISFLTYV